MENEVDTQYIMLLKDIIDNGILKDTRTGRVFSVFDRTMRLNLNDGFPLLTTKKMYIKGIIYELLWFLRGDTNIKYLIDNNVHIWDDDAYRFYREKVNSYFDFHKEYNNKKTSICSKDEFLEKVINEEYDERLTCCASYYNTELFFDRKRNYKFGDLGPIYGEQWRNYGFNGDDQIRDIITKLRVRPNDRRMILSGWNIDALKDVALPACHVFAEFYTKKLSFNERKILLDKKINTNSNLSMENFIQLCKGNAIPEYKLSCSFVCRSQDIFLGTPFNIASYALLTHMLAQCANMTVDELIWHGMDCHIYENHLDAIYEQIGNDPNKYSLPELSLNRDIKDIDKFTYKDISLINYNSYKAIKAPLSVGI